MKTKYYNEKDWNVSAREAIKIQENLRNTIALIPLSKPIKTIAGVDVSLNRFGEDLYAGIIVLEYPSLIPITYATKKVKVTFPYIPGLLSFREIPGLLQCFEKLTIIPDLIVVDGQGIAHPRRLGIASHLGAILNIPTIGCAKSRLTGVYQEPQETGGSTIMYDLKTQEEIGRALKSKKRSKPLIISPGNLITIDESLTIVRSCLRGYRLPEPTRLAHSLVNKFRKGEL